MWVLWHTVWYALICWCGPFETAQGFWERCKSTESAYRAQERLELASGCRRLKRWVCPLTSGHFAPLIRRQGGESNEAENSHQLYTKPDRLLPHGPWVALKCGLRTSVDAARTIKKKIWICQPNNSIGWILWTVTSMHCIQHTSFQIFLPPSLEVWTFKTKSERVQEWESLYGKGLGGRGSSSVGMLRCWVDFLPLYIRVHLNQGQRGSIEWKRKPSALPTSSTVNFLSINSPRVNSSHANPPPKVPPLSLSAHTDQSTVPLSVHAEPSN